MRRAGLLRLFTLALIWGSSFLWIKLALRGLSPAQIVLVRLGLGALVLIPFVYRGGGRLPRSINLWSHLAIAALFANVIPYLLFGYGERQVDSAIAGVLNATTPLWTVLIATAVALERRPTALKLAGIGLGFLGVLIVFAPWRLGSQIMSWGGLACLLAAASYGISYVYMGRFLTGRGLTPLTLSASQLVAATFLSVLTLALPGQQAFQLRSDALVAVAILGALGTGAAYVLNYRLITDDGASAASLVTYLIPIVAVILGALTLGESLTLNVIVGMVIVLAAVGLTRARTASARMAGRT
jgi:drug/metabolite transporter (DMT)-like permease